MLCTFNQLPVDQKAEQLWLKGRFLFCRLKNGYSVSLYALDSFYVELYYNPNTCQMVDIVAFKETGRLTPYLDKISLDKLM